MSPPPPRAAVEPGRVALVPEDGRDGLRPTVMVVQGAVQRDQPHVERYTRKGKREYRG